MQNYPNHPNRLLLAAGLVLAAVAPSQAQFVTPQMGGGQIAMMGGAPMKHLDITFDGTDLAVHIDETVATPLLRPLEAPDAFDPAEPWSVLSGKAYNFQYGWNPGGFISLPEGAGIWIERLNQDPGLETYTRPPAFGPAYTAIFEDDGDTWQWSGAMTHNVYAVEQPLTSSYQAIYRIYLGDLNTGEALPGYGSAEVTLNFDATPVPEPAFLGIASLLPVLMRRRRGE